MNGGIMADKITELRLRRGTVSIHSSIGDHMLTIEYKPDDDPENQDGFSCIQLQTTEQGNKVVLEFV